MIHMITTYNHEYLLLFIIYIPNIISYICRAIIMSKDIVDLLALIIFIIGCTIIGILLSI